MRLNLTYIILRLSLLTLRLFRADERERVKKAGAQVYTFDQVLGTRSMEDEDFGTEEKNANDPPRIWWNNAGAPLTSPHDEHKCVAFTRSIGDAEVERYGVTADPEISQQVIEPQVTS